MRLSQAQDEEEGDDVLVIRAEAGSWQVGPATARAPETLTHDWNCALDVTRAVELMGNYLDTVSGLVAPNVLVVVDSVELRRIGETIGRSDQEPQDLTSLLKAEKLRLDDPEPVLRAGSGPLLRAVAGEDAAEAGAVEWARFLLEVVGFRSVVLLDGRHAALYERGATTTCSVDVSNGGCCACLGVVEGQPVSEAVEECGLDAGAAAGRAVASVIKRAPLDARPRLLESVYVYGSGVAAGGGAERLADALAEAAAEALGEEVFEVEVVVPPNHKHRRPSGTLARLELAVRVP